MNERPLKIYIFLPNDVEKNETLEGFVRKTSQEVSFFAINNYMKISPEFIGYTGRENGFRQTSTNDYFNVEIVDGKAVISRVKLNGTYIDIASINYQFFCIRYDRMKFEKTKLFTVDAALQVPNDRFQILSREIKKAVRLQKETVKRYCFNYLTVFKIIFSISNYFMPYIDKVTHITKYSSTLTHILNSMRMLQSISKTTIENNGLTLHVSNQIVAVFVDIVCGIFIVHHVSQWDELSAYALKSVSSAVANLRDLLEWLMGSPGGLKLNESFNGLLGKFFLYHITLWWAFLMAFRAPLTQMLYFLQLIGPFGITFAMALIADLIALTTFHIYCIYVYAARFYRFQIMGLSSLLRLFLGRKFNPLRGRVDSCQYSNRQLFVGTLAFTILLFLLPTTTMYYAVFATLRLLLILIDQILLKIRNLMKFLPLLIILLWVINAPSVSGNIRIDLNNPVKHMDNFISLSVTLTSHSLWQTVRLFIPTKEHTNKSFSQIFHNLIVGILM